MYVGFLMRYVAINNDLRVRGEKKNYIKIVKKVSSEIISSKDCLNLKAYTRINYIKIALIVKCGNFTIS